MERPDDKMRPCSGCPALVLWAKHAKDGTNGKAAPLVRAQGDEKPNICIQSVGSSYQYYIAGSQQDDGTQAPEWVNHFSNCPAAARFRPKKGK